MGKWNLSAPAPADAQHWGAAGVSGPDAEDGSDQVGTSDYVGGRALGLHLARCRYGFNNKFD